MVRAYSQTDFERVVNELNLIDNWKDWSSEKKIILAEPNCAYVNITGISNMPTTKTQDLKAWMEFYDGGQLF